MKAPQFRMGREVPTGSEIDRIKKNTRTRDCASGL